jgi:hypothetical protein
VHYLPATVPGLESRTNLLDIEILHLLVLARLGSVETRGLCPMARVGLDSESTRAFIKLQK